MNEDDIKNALYGSIKELMKNRKYFYDGFMKPSWSDEGKVVLGEIVEMYSAKIIEAQKEADDRRAKDLVVKGLKGEKI